MSTRHKLLYAASVAACFLIGCIAALALQAYDAREASPTPLPEGQTIDFSAYGFTLTVPETYSPIPRQCRQSIFRARQRSRR